MRDRIKTSRGVTKVVAGAIACLLAGGAVVYAHNGDPGKVHACVNFSNGGVIITGAPTDSGFMGTPDAVCVDGQTAVDWGATGAPGPQGPQGPAGPPGPAGESGTLRTVTKRIGANRAIVKTGRANCPKGQHIVTGGYNLPGNIPAVTAKESRPSGTTGWYARAFRARGNGAWTLVVYAVCST